MFDCEDVTAAVEAPPTDPRLTGESLRCIPGADGAGTVLLVGVVHDHPASVFRVARVLESISPDVLALELPPLAVPLFRTYARDGPTPPRLGGEMSRAIQAAGDVTVVGIDGPNRTYLRTLLGDLVDGRLPRAVLAPVLKDVVTSGAQALTCRLGALLGAFPSLSAHVYSPIQYDCTPLDSPSTQATHETEHRDQQRAFMQAIQVPRSIRVIDGAREESMVARLRDVRTAGDVVAVVGLEHLDWVEERLASAA